MMKQLPNILTLGNAFMGCIALKEIFEQNYWNTFWLILAASIFDFADGLVARCVDARSDLGKELDSLADAISFGVVPGLLAFSWMYQHVDPPWLAYSGFLLTLFAILRLAHFNISTQQESFFIGLPTPANALFFASLCATPLFGDIDKQLEFYLMPFIVVVFSLLMISPIPLFSMKFDGISVAKNIWQYTLLEISVLWLVYWQISGVLFIILTYLVMSFFYSLSEKKL